MYTVTPWCVYVISMHDNSNFHMIGTRMQSPRLSNSNLPMCIHTQYECQQGEEIFDSCTKYYHFASLLLNHIL